MDDKLCMNCFNTYGRQFDICPKCGYIEGTPPEQPHCLVPGTILGNHFIVGTVIGIGGFGITYRCFDMTLANTVAIKEFFPKGLVNRSPGETKVSQLSGEKKQLFYEQKARFHAEAKSIAQFGKAKDIVNIYDYIEENGTAYIVMEYIDGVLLKDYLDKKGAMEQSVALGMIMPIIEAVKKIHSKGIIHKDVSPDNIFITDDKSIKIFDFGAAQLNDSKDGQAGEKVIKMGYSAPEQYRDKSRQGFYTDVYSVGAILYQMLTGKKPIESTEREHKDRLRSPLELGFKVNSNIDRAVMEALAVQPELLDFILYSLYNENFKCQNHYAGKATTALCNIGIKFVEHCRKTAREALDASRRFKAPHHIQSLAERAKAVISIGNQTGEGWFLTGEMLELIEEGTKNIVCVQPFGCLPNHIMGKGVIKEIRRQHADANIVAIDYDPGASEANQLNRIKLMLSAAVRNMESEAALA